MYVVMHSKYTIASYSCVYIDTHIKYTLLISLFHCISIRSIPCHISCYHVMPCHILPYHVISYHSRWS